MKVTALLLPVFVTAGGAYGAVSFDHSHAQRLAGGTTIGGVAVGNLDRDAAVALLKQKLEAPLHQTLRVSVEGFQTTTTPWDLGRRIDVAKAVDDELKRENSPNLLVRLWRRTVGDNSQTIALQPSWHAAQAPAIDKLLKEAAKGTALAAKDATLETSDSWLHISPDRAGRALDTPAARRVLLTAVARGRAEANLPTKSVAASRTADSFGTVILVRTGENKLYLYKNGVVTATYGVATGQPAFPTPTGTWRVLYKMVNPTWNNPHSTWSTKMPEKIGPGPDNPLGTHAMALNAPGILIHETSDAGSIGYNASHGCIRMRPSDEQALFPLVPSGTPVIVVNAAPAKVRKAAAPAATPTQIAQTQY
ncbi:MAG: L,D-transpeptidase family protein [Actinobacteria bacterium]|nr:L,D-transpeptidase family protein [Actinomycetota bacterium]MBV9253257.1 L,D-transpeptidase family protein [Actinomycetota bacterium]